MYYRISGSFGPRVHDFVSAFAEQAGICRIGFLVFKQHGVECVPQLFRFYGFKPIARPLHGVHRLLLQNISRGAFEVRIDVFEFSLETLVRLIPTVSCRTLCIIMWIILPIRCQIQVQSTFERLFSHPIPEHSQNRGALVARDPVENIVNVISGNA